MPWFCFVFCMLWFLLIGDSFMNLLGFKEVFTCIYCARAVLVCFVRSQLILFYVASVNDHAK